MVAGRLSTVLAHSRDAVSSSDGKREKFKSYGCWSGRYSRKCQAERGDVTKSMLLYVLCISHCQQVSTAVRLVIGHVMRLTRQERKVKCLHFTICLWLVLGSDRMVYAELVAKSHEKLENKLRAFVRK